MIFFRFRGFEWPAPAPEPWPGRHNPLTPGLCFSKSRTRCGREADMSRYHGGHGESLVPPYTRGSVCLSDPVFSATSTVRDISIS